MTAKDAGMSGCKECWQKEIHLEKESQVSRHCQDHKIARHANHPVGKYHVLNAYNTML